MPGLVNMTAEQRREAHEAGRAARAAKSAARRAAGVPTLSQAVRAYCFECSYDPADSGSGSALAQIRACPVIRCPLWPHRPGAAVEMPDSYEPRTPNAVLAEIRGGVRGGCADASDADAAADVDAGDDGSRLPLPASEAQDGSEETDDGI